MMQADSASLLPMIGRALGLSLLLLLQTKTKSTSSSGDLQDAILAIPTLHLDLRYAQEHNIAGHPLYHSARCLLRPEVIEALRRVQAALQSEALSLLVWDCYRPARVQRELWQHAPIPGLVANPKHGSNHTRGAAVDVSLCTTSGKPLVMPTEFDDFSPAAEQAAVKGVSAEARRNRGRLVAAMRAAGFHTIRREWWHFDAPGALDLALVDAEPWIRLSSCDR
jgi:zinc D-Ala-D-Ala dipeptidase